MTFKFFRTYNKWLLAIGMTVLMVVFLVESALPKFQDYFHRNVTVGTFNGGKISAEQHHHAARELQILERIQPGQRDPVEWMLMVEEAKQMGLGVSDYEIDQTFLDLGLTPTIVEKFARDTGASTEDVREAFRHWLLVQNYR